MAFRPTAGGSLAKAAVDARFNAAVSGQLLMRVFFNGLVLGLILGAGLGWWAHQRWKQTAVTKSDRFRAEAARAMDAAGEAIYRAGEALRAKAEALNLRPEQIKEELARTGRIVRRQARELTDQVADATVDAATTAAIKSKLAADPELSALSIGVSTSAGRVTLEGKVANESQIAKAVTLALGTERVVDVTAKLQVKPTD